MAVAIASGDIDFGVTAVSGGLLNLAARGDTVRIFGGALEEADGVPGHKILASKAAFDGGLQSPMELDASALPSPPKALRLNIWARRLPPRWRRR